MAAFALLAAAPSAALAQEPRPDSVPADTLVADTLPGDTLPPPPDTVFHNLPSLEVGLPEGWATGVWSWSHEEIMASGAHTLVELFDDVPGIVPLPAGDYGTPSVFSAFGLGAGGVRILRDGFEVLPLAGGVVDLQRVGLAGIEHVTLRRSAGQLVVELASFDHDDARPYSLVEAGTGDLDNNLFRGTYVDPSALGGSLGVGLERSDSRGGGPGETGSRTGTWVRYALHRGDVAGIAVDFRRMGSRSELPDYPSPLTRTDLVLRGRAAITGGVVVEGYTGRSSYDVGDERALFATEGGTRSQHGIRITSERGGLWSDTAFRLYGGGGLLENRFDVQGGWDRPGVGGVAARFTREDWVGARPKNVGVSTWLGPVLGISLFGSWDSGRYGARSAPLLDIAPPADPAGPTDPTNPVDPPMPAWMTREAPELWVTDRTTWRLGGMLEAWGATVSGAVLGIEHDLALPLALAPDLGAHPVPGQERRGWEVYGSLPMPLEGLRLVGAYQEWDHPGPYLPARIYRGAFDYNRTFMESGNFELWASLGVRGHDPMQVFVPLVEGGAEAPLATVPFYQSWDGRIQVRIVTVRIFVSWENATVRRNLQAFPGRVLYPLRTSYGIRWTMWN